MIISRFHFAPLSW